MQLKPNGLMMELDTSGLVIGLEMNGLEMIGLEMSGLTIGLEMNGLLMGLDTSGLIAAHGLKIFLENGLIRLLVSGVPIDSGKPQLRLPAMQAPPPSSFR